MCIWKALPGGLLNEVAATPLSLTSKTSASLSSITDVDSMVVSVFTKIALPCFACEHSTAGVMPWILRRLCVVPQWVSCKHKT